MARDRRVLAGVASVRAGERSVGGNPVVVEWEVRSGRHATQRRPGGVVDGVVAVVGDVDDVDDAGLDRLCEALSHVALGKGGCGGNDFAGESWRTNRQECADDLGTDADSEQAPQTKREADRIAQTRWA